MKVFGQLEVAQFENLASDPALAPRGRPYFNTADSKVKVHDGTQWRALAYESTAATSSIYDIPNVGGDIVVDWANGSVQKLSLSANQKISFASTGLTDGQTYTLIVENSSATPYTFLFDVLMDTEGKLYQPIWMDIGETRTYTFLYRATAGTTLKVFPALGEGPLQTITNGSGTGRAIDVFEKIKGYKRLIVSGTGTSSNITTWTNEPQAGKQSFSTRDSMHAYAQTANSLKISPSGKMYAVSSAASPYMGIFPMNANNNAQTSANFANPGTLPAGAGTSIDWHPSERAIAIAHGTTPFITAYPVATNAFGTKYANPATLPASTGIACRFSPFGDYLAVLHATTPFLSVYPFDVVLGFGSKVTDPSTLPPGNATNALQRGVAWRPQGDWILCASATSPYLYQVPFDRASGTFGTPVAVSGLNLPSAEVLSIEFHPSGMLVAVGWTGGLSVFPFDATTGIDNANAYTFTSAVTGNWYDVTWSKDGKYIWGVRSSTALPESMALPYLGVNWYRINDK